MLGGTRNDALIDVSVIEVLDINAMRRIGQIEPADGDNML